MDKHVNFVQTKRLERVAEALRAHNMEAQVVGTAAEVVPLVRSMMAEGCTVANGGSMTLEACGVMDLLRSGAYNFLDRDVPGADKAAIYRASFGADVYLASANAVTLGGEIYEMDGNANRVAALAFGPESVILVVGVNKIVTDIDAARRRNFEIAAPANNHRLGNKTPCAATGVCIDCKSPARICCTELILHQQRVNGRMKVIFVNEPLGY